MTLPLSPSLPRLRLWAGALAVVGTLLANASPLEVASLPPAPDRSYGPRQPDWLVVPAADRAALFRGSSATELHLDNGLIRRSFRLAPNGATVGFDNLMTGASVIRSIQPEATLTIDGQPLEVGGLAGLPEHAYLRPEWIPGLTNRPGAFQLAGVRTGPVEARLAWKRKRHAQDLPWPPPGMALHFDYRSTDPRLDGLQVTVHYELYDGLPVLGKWLSLTNGTSRAVRLDAVTTELLAVVEAESVVDTRHPKDWRQPLLEVFSDYAFRGMDLRTASRTTEWLTDPTYTSQVNYELKTPALVVSRPPVGPSRVLAPGEPFTSFRTFVLLYDRDERERQGLAQRRALRALAPWSTENPIMMHVRSADRATFRNAVDQCAEVGFEMIIYTFGSGLNMEDTRPEYLARIREDVAYAHAKGIEVGAYSLFSSRSISPEHDAIHPATGKPGGAIFGNAPCLASQWGVDYLQKLRTFIEATGLDLLEHDGPYPGDLCASTNHPGHQGLEDSQWVQWSLSSDLYGWCRARGVYVNQPDFYFLNGGSKTGMGYREVNWSLPRERQILLGRQNIFDGTWTRSPTMGWMFVPLTEYQGGGAAATLEPLRDHLPAYEAHLINNFAAGVQACFRGPRLFDSDATRDLVKHWVAWFKRHRAILESDIIHVRRADGRDVDVMLHVNPRLPVKGLAAVWNPLDQPVQRRLELPLYYTGLTNLARFRVNDGKGQRARLSRDYTVTVPVSLPARGFAWITIE